MRKNQPLYMKIAFQPAYAEAARIIGYGGCGPFEFWDAAKKLPDYKQDEMRRAMFDLTRTDRREASPPRYEFNAEARHAAIQVLGFPPEHPLYSPKDPPAEEHAEVPEEQPAKPKPRRRGRAR